MTHLDGVYPGYKTSVRRDDAGGTVLDLRVDVEDVNLALCPPLLLVEVRHHLLDLGQRLLQLLAVLVRGVSPLRVLQDI